jgi:Xaa-Pro aminopeptidase
VSAEVERRHGNVRAALAEAGLDACLACGSEYTGFDGAVLYLSGFQIVHRYAYVLLPLEGEPTLVCPSEARYVGEHGASWVEDQVFAETPGEWLRERFLEQGWRRVGVHGLDYVLPVRDFRALAAGDTELVAFDEQFDLARAVKSDEEMRSVRESMSINEEGFWRVLEAYGPGRTEAEIMAPSASYFVAAGTGRHAMNMVLSGERGRSLPEFKIPSETRRVEADDLLLFSLEIAGPGGHWVEFSRALIAGEPSGTTRAMSEAYAEYGQAIAGAMRDGATAHDVHRAASRPFLERGYSLGHVTGHSIGMTMIEHPRIGEGIDVELKENMVFSCHPHAIAEDGSTLYMQDTFRIGKSEGEPLSRVPLTLFSGSETRV